MEVIGNHEYDPELEQKFDILALIEEKKRRLKEEAINYYNTSEPIHKKQVTFHQSLAKIRGLLGGNRTGKTCGGAAEAVMMATGRINRFKDVKVPVPNRGWVVSLSNEVQRDVAQREVLRWLPKNEIKHISIRRGSKDNLEEAIIDTITLKNGSTIGFKSCEQGVGVFQGTSRHWIWLDEEPPEDIWRECQMRVMDTDGYMWVTMTPLLGLTFIYEDIYLNVNQNPNVECFSMQWSDNPHLSPDVIKHLESTLTEEELEARQFGRFVALSGLIYKEFDEDIHVIDPFDVPHFWYDKIAIDPGYTNATSAHFYACDPEGNIYVIAEYYDSGKQVKHVADKLHKIADNLGWEKTKSGKLRAIMDSAANQRTIAAEKSTAELFRDNKIMAEFVDKSVWVGIQRVKGYLECRPDPQEQVYDKGPNKGQPIWPKGKPKLFIFKTCPNMIRELKHYRWAENKGHKENDKETPKKLNDHACISGDTLIDTVDGQFKIKDLVGKEGFVRCYDYVSQTSDVQYFKDVTLTQENTETFELKFEDGTIITTTADHPILTTKDYVCAIDLTEQDEIIVLNNQENVWEPQCTKTTKIKSIRQVESQPVYNMTVENVHNFSVEGGLIIKNCDELRYYVMSRPDAAELAVTCIAGTWSYGELKLKGYSDFQIRQFVKNGKIKLIGHMPNKRSI